MQVETCFLDSGRHGLHANTLKMLTQAGIKQSTDERLEKQGAFGTGRGQSKCFVAKGSGKWILAFMLTSI